eukprot:scaffold621_cov157-Amphora_coffeaeformis.AAC.2
MSIKSKSSASETGRHQDHDLPGQPILIQAIVTPRGTMNHTYSDFSQVPPATDYKPATDIATMTFAEKVHHILSQPEYEADISWMPHGRAFKVHRPGPFEKGICKQYFGHGRYSSFLRQLNNHGFKHISQGADRNCYYHQYMLKDRPHLCQYMPRAKDARRVVADPQNEPNLYHITELYPLNTTARSSKHRIPVHLTQPKVVTSTMLPSTVSKSVTPPSTSPASLPTSGVTTTTHPNKVAARASTTAAFVQNTLSILPNNYRSLQTSSLVAPMPFRPPVVAQSAVNQHLAPHSLRDSLFGLGILPSQITALLQQQQEQQRMSIVIPHMASFKPAPPANGNDLLLRLAMVVEQAELRRRAASRYS